MISSQWDFSGTNLRLRYDAGKYSDGREYLGVDEYRPLGLLDADLAFTTDYREVLTQAMQA
jgi:hypothetical protein